MNVIQGVDLTKSYGKLKAIDHLSLEIEENGITGLIGRNGSGKTTLLKMLAGYLKPTSLKPIPIWSIGLLSRRCLRYFSL